MKTKNRNKGFTRGDEDGGNEERNCNTVNKEQRTKWSDLVKKDGY